MTSTNNYNVEEIYSIIETLALGSQELQTGDGNGDGLVNVLDVVMTVQYVLGNIDVSEQQFDAIDMNQDNTVNVLDIVSLVTIILES